MADSEPMGNRPMLTARLDQAVIDRIDAVAVALKEKAHGLEVNRSDATRVVVERGLRELETELGISKRKSK